MRVECHRVRRGRRLCVNSGAVNSRYALQIFGDSDERLGPTNDRAERGSALYPAQRGADVSDKDSAAGAAVLAVHCCR